MSDEKTEKPEVTVQEMDQLVTDMFALRAEIDLDKEKLSAKNATLEQMQAKAVAAMKQLERENYKCTAGTVYITQKWRVNTPKEEADKKAFFVYLRDKGILWEYITVNSNSLNSYFMTEWENAKERGDGMGFKIPGIPEPSLFETVGMRKK